MNKYRLLRLILASAAVLAGGIYLAAGEAGLAAVLPLMCVCFGGIAVVSWCESRAAGAAGWAAMLPALSAALVAVFAAIGTAAYFGG